MRFNIILDSRGKKGNKKIDRNTITEFRECIQEIDALHLPSKGFEFTWSNKRGVDSRIYTKIDHLFCDEEWNNKFPNYQLDYEAPTLSDYSPGILSIEMVKHQGPKPFKFIKGWMKHPKFKKTMEDSWNAPIQGNPQIRLARMLLSRETPRSI